MKKIIRKSAGFRSILGIMNIEEEPYQVVGTCEGDECWRSNDAGGQEHYEPRSYYTNRLASSQGRLYWVYQDGRHNNLHRIETTDASSVGKWNDPRDKQEENSEFYLDQPISRIIWKSEIKRDQNGELYMLD